MEYVSEKWFVDWFDRVDSNGTSEVLKAFIVCVEIVVEFEKDVLRMASIIFVEEDSIELWVEIRSSSALRIASLVDTCSIVFKGVSGAKLGTVEGCVA